MGREYIKFIYNIRYYLEQELYFIDILDSNYSDYLQKIQYKGLIGKIDDLEICFLHYKNEKEAKEKWDRRKKE